MSETESPLAADGNGTVRDAEGLAAMERKFADAALDLIASGEKMWRGKAAEKAGYACARNAAYELIRRPHVIAYMARNMTEAAETVKVDRSFVLFRALANMAACEAREDFRTAHRYLDTIAKHADVRAFTAAPGDGDQAGRLSLPFDTSRLSTTDMEQLITILRKAGSGAAPE